MHLPDVSCTNRSRRYHGSNGYFGTSDRWSANSTVEVVFSLQALNPVLLIVPFMISVDLHSTHMYIIPTHVLSELRS